MKTQHDLERPWPALVLIWCMGLLAAAQLGKMSALLVELRGGFGLSLVEAGWLASLLEAGGATLGLVAGLLVARLGHRRALGLGLLLLAAGGLGEALAPSIVWLVLSRLFEAAGYVFLVIAAPSMIASVAPDRLRGAAFALWSTFVPAGLALGVAVTGSAAHWLSIREIFLGWGLLAALVCLAWLGLPRGAPRANAARLVLPRARIWVITIGFGCFTVGEVGMLAMLPAYLVEELMLSSSAAGLIAGAASLATLAGSYVAGRILSRMKIGTALVRYSALSLIAGAVFAFPVFLLAGVSLADWAPGLAAACAMLANAIVGIYPALVFARLADLGRTPEGIAAANGAITQFGAGGALIGPPLAGLVAGLWGWPAVSPVIAVSFLAACGMTWLAERRGAEA